MIHSRMCDLCKSVPKSPATADGKNGHITYDVGLNVNDILEVAEYLGRVC